MESTVNERVLMLKTHLDLSDVSFSEKVGMSTGTLHRIKKGENISSKTLKLIIQNTLVSKSWLVKGTGEMFENDVESVSSKSGSVSSWREEAYELIKDQRDEYKKQVQFLQSLISKQMGIDLGNFNTGISLVALLNGKKCVDTVSAPTQMVA